MDKPAEKAKEAAKAEKSAKTGEGEARREKKKEVKDFRIFNEEIAAVVAGVHANPFAVLGIHEFGKQFVARTFIPGAEEVTACTLSLPLRTALACPQSAARRCRGHCRPAKGRCRPCRRAFRHQGRCRRHPGTFCH